MAAAGCGVGWRGFPSYTMQIPRLLDRVRVTGYPYPFFVIAIDEEQKCVDLLQVSGSPVKCLESVPFQDLRRNSEDVHAKNAAAG